MSLNVTQTIGGHSPTSVRELISPSLTKASSTSKRSSMASSSLIGSTSKGQPAFDWNSFLDRSTILQKLKETGQFCDIMIVTGDGSRHLVHSSVMSALSRKISDAIYAQLNDPSTPTIKITDKQSITRLVKRIDFPSMTNEVALIVIDCAYTGYIASGLDGIWDILRVAEEYDMHDVIQACCNYLMHQIKLSNCVDLLYLGIKYQHKLRTTVWNTIKYDFQKLVEEGPGFSKLTLEHFESLLDDDELNIEQEDVAWDSIRRWILFDPITRSSSLCRLLRHLRHGRVLPRFLTENLAVDPLICGDSSASKLVNHLIKQNREEFEKQRLDGYGIPVAFSPKHIRPRIPSSIIFAIGGWQEGVPTTLVETYDVRTNKWFASKTLHHYPRAYHGMEIINGVIYLIGGTNGTEIMNTVHCYDPVTGRWFQRANMYEQRCYVSTAVLNGQLYAMGGHNGLQRIRTVEMYDHVKNQWTKMPDMNLARSDACATIHEGKIYIAGGLNDQVIENSVEFFDPISNTWSFIQPMNSPRTSLALVTYRGSLYALGGNNGFERLPTVERYDFTENSWVSAPSMRSRRSTFSACVLEDRIYVVGGYNGHTPISQVEKYDGNSQEWTVIKNLKHDRSGLSVCVLKNLPNGKDFTYLGSSCKSLLKNSYARNARNLFRRRIIQPTHQHASQSTSNNEASSNNENVNNPSQSNNRNC